MRILIISRELPPKVGGAGSYTFNLAIGMAEIGHSVTIISVSKRMERGVERQVDEQLYRAGVEKVIRVNFVSKVYLFLMCRAVIKIINKEVYDVALVADSGAQKALSLCLSQLKLPVWVIFHGSEIKNFYHNRSLFFRLFGGKNRINRLWKIADGCIAVSHYLEGVVGEAVPWLSPKMHTVLHGIDTAAFSPDLSRRSEVRKVLGITDRTIVLFSASRLVEAKGQDVLLRIMPDILREEADTLLVIAGGGPYEEVLKKIARNNGLEKCVKFVGELNREQMISYYRACDLFILLSKESNEAFGLVYLEANACGAPVVANNNAGAREAVEDNVSGLLLDLHNDNFPSRIVEIISSPSLRSELSYLGLQRVRLHFSARNMADNTAKLIACHSGVR